MIGMQDINLSLRETLKTYMSTREVCDDLKQRWMVYRRRADQAHRIVSEQTVLDKEWNEIKNMELTEEPAAVATGPPPASAASLVYLEDIHVFALANMLKRPIIVIALKTIRNIQPIDLRGIYLPTLVNDPNECVKDPIVIAFHNYHFVPLVFAFDKQSVRPNNNDLDRILTYTEKFFHFENVDRIAPPNVDDDDDLDDADVRQPNMIPPEFKVTCLRILFDYSKL